MKIGLKLIAIVVVLVLVGSYALYAFNYKGKYNVETNLTLNVDEYGGVAIANFEYDCSPVSYGDFWDLFKGHSVPEGMTGYIIYYTLNQSGETSTRITSAVVPNGESSVVSLTLNNLDPGAASLKVSIRDSHNALLAERTFEVIVR